MSAKLAFPSALILAVLSCGAISAQAPPTPMNAKEVPVPVITPGNEAIPPAEATPAPQFRPPLAPGLSDWITYTKPDCCGPIGGNGPIRDELYVRTGPALPISGAIFGHVLTPGWEVQGGGRVLFFNTEADRAWTVDLSIASVWYGGQHDDRTFPLQLLVPGPISTPGGTPDASRAQVVGVLRQLNRTSVDLTLGREWYLIGKASSCGCGERSWRIGIDGGGGYGTESANVHIMTTPGNPAIDLTTGTAFVVNTLRRRTDTVGTALVSLHTDLEIPCGCCIYQFGFRAEWGYTWSDILQRQNNSDQMDVNLLLNFGVRF